MTAEDAAYLAELVSDQYPDAATCYQLGNGESVVRIHRTPDEDWFLWDFHDWKHYRHAEKAAARTQRAKANAERKARRREEALACA